MGNRSRVGVLDIGSNSVRLLVAEISRGRAFFVHTDKITSRLLAGFEGGELARDSIDRTGEAIFSLAERARALGAERVEGFGTSAMRDGANRGELLRRAKAWGVPIRVLSGEEEAALAYAGAAPKGRMGVMDIGGGSTELLVGEDGRVRASFSARIGAVRLAERFSFACDPARVRACARAALEPAWTAVGSGQVDGWVGVGGTITSLSAMCLGLEPFVPEPVEGHRLTRRAAEDWLERLCGTTVQERAQIPGLNPERADIIPFGVAILVAFYELSGASALRTSVQDNLMGFVQKYLLEGVDKL